MDDDILDDIGGLEENEKEELEVYKDMRQEENIKNIGKHAPKTKKTRAPTVKDKGPMGEELEDAPPGQEEVDDYEEALRKEEALANAENQPKVRMPEEQIPIVVVRELPTQQVPQREVVDEDGKKIRLVTIEEALTMLFNK